MKTLNRTGIVVFLMILAAPLLQPVFKILPEAPLVGVELETKKPVLTLPQWISGQFQKNYETWLGEQIGLRSFFVRTYNQIFFWTFNQLPSNKGTPVIIGKNYWLYQQPYIDSYNRSSKFSRRHLRALVSQVKQLQDLISAHGKVFLLVISPSKAEIYPEYVPANMKVPDRQHRKTEYDNILPVLDEYGINYLDGHKVFLEKKQSQPYPLFPTGGTHWNYYGAGIILKMILDNIEQNLGRQMSTFTCTSVRVDHHPFGTDNDLGDLMNIWFSKSMAGPQIHPVFEKQERGFSPNLLFVGSSFVYTLTHIIHTEQLAREWDSFFYFKRRGGELEKGASDIIEASRMDWEKEVLQRDAVIIEINESQLPDIGFGFVKAALAGLTSGTPGKTDQTLTKTEVSELYVSIFNRASEGKGNAFWRNETDMASAAASMLATDAAKNYFGANLDSDQAFIEHIYQHTLNKTYRDDPAGIDFWVDALGRGFTRGEVIASLIDAIRQFAAVKGPGQDDPETDAPGTSAAYKQFANRVEISNYMADKVRDLPADWERSTRFMETGLKVTDEASTVVTARKVVDSF